MRHNDLIGPALAQLVIRSKRRAVSEPNLEYQIWQRATKWHWQVSEVIPEVRQFLASGVADSARAARIAAWLLCGFCVGAFSRMTFTATSQSGSWPSGTSPYKDHHPASWGCGVFPGSGGGW